EEAPRRSRRSTNSRSLVMTIAPASLAAEKIAASWPRPSQGRLALRTLRRRMSQLSTAQAPERAAHRARSSCGKDRVIQPAARKPKSGRNVLPLESGHLLQNLRDRETRSKEIEHVSDPDPHPTNAGTPSALLRIYRDPIHDLLHDFLQINKRLPQTSTQSNHLCQSRRLPQPVLRPSDKHGV